MKSLFDVQVNGFAGVDFQQPGLSAAELRRAVGVLADHQTLRFFATLITDAPEALGGKLEQLERLRAGDSAVGAALCGYHLEGPWLSPEQGFYGAHDSRHMIAPEVRTFEYLQRAAGGNIRLVTLAPEFAGYFIPFIRSARRERGCRCRWVTRTLLTRKLTPPSRPGPGSAPIWETVCRRNCTGMTTSCSACSRATNSPHFSFLTGFTCRRGSCRISSAPNRPARRCLPLMQWLRQGHPPDAIRWAAWCLTWVTTELSASRDGPTSAGSALCADQGVKNVQNWLGLAAATARELFSTAVADLFHIELPPISESL